MILHVNEKKVDFDDFVDSARTFDSENANDL